MYGCAVYIKVKFTYASAGLPSIALHRGDPVRMQAFGALQKIARRHLLARKPYLEGDFQFVVLLLYECATAQESWDLLSDRQQAKINWFENLVTQANSNQLAGAELSDGVLLDIFSLLLRRMMPYNFDQLPLSTFCKHIKPMRHIKTKQFLVVSLCHKKLLHKPYSKVTVYNQ